jgi:hypothetical protein
MKTTVINNKPFTKIMIHKNDLSRPDPLIVKFIYDVDGILNFGITLASNHGAIYQDFAVWRECIDEFIPFTGTITIEV